MALFYIDSNGLFANLVNANSREPAGSGFPRDYADPQSVFQFPLRTDFETQI